MNLDPLLRALERARPDGRAVRDWSVYVSETRLLTLGIKDREVGNAHTPLKLSESCGARYRVIWDDGKVSRGYVERRLLETAPDEALLHARDAAFDDADSAWVVGPGEYPEVELFDERAATLAAGRVDALVPRLERLRRRVSDGAFRTWSGSFTAGRGRSRVVTSAGLDVGSEGTSCGWYVSLNGEIGDGFSARAAEDLDEFDGRLGRLARTAELLDRTATAPSSGTQPVLLHPHVVDSYVIGTLLDNLNGPTVAHGEGHFRPEQFGSNVPVMREDLGYRIDPLVPLKSGSYRYTTEGVPAAPWRFIERGRLVSPILDLKYARRMGLEPTPAPADADTMHFEGPTPLTLDAALEHASGGVLVLSVLGVHTQDSASGDFSLSAPQALAVGSGKPLGRVRGTISGNLFSTLGSDSLQFVDFPGENTPGLLFACRYDPQ